MWERNGVVCWFVGEVLGMLETIGLWGRCGEVYGVSVEVVGKWEKVCWDVRRCGEVSGTPHTLLHLPYTSSHTHPTPLPTRPHSSNTSTSHPSHSPDTYFHTHLPPPHTLSHLYSPPPTPLPTLTLPDTFPNTSSQPPRLFQHFLILPMLYHLPHTKISHFSHLLPQ